MNKRQYEKLKKQLDVYYKDIYSDILRENESLKKDLDTESKHCDALTKKLDDVNIANDKLENEKQDLELEVANCHKDISQLRDEVDFLQMKNLESQRRFLSFYEEVINKKLQ